jgi:hypothetical protein
MSGGTSIWHSTDGQSVTVFNDSEISDDRLRAEFIRHPELNVMAEWANFVTDGPATRRSSGIFERDKYVTPSKIFDQMKTARIAAENDDIVSGVLEVTESLAFSKMYISVPEDRDEEQIWNKIIEEIELLDRVKEMWRELFICSQYYAAMIWGSKSFALDGQGEKRRRRKSYTLQTPTGVSLLDPLKIAPFGNFLFGQEKLLYLADRAEGQDIKRVLAGQNTTDLIVTQLLQDEARLTNNEKRLLQEVTGFNFNYVFDFAPGAVWRHTATRPAYARFAPVRIKSVFQYLDLKHQLQAMDRAHLLGASNFIVVIKKGTDDHPADQKEIQALSSAVRQVARVPLIVGDHRLSVEIITPKVDITLEPKRYNAIDSRIAARLYQIYHIGSFSAGTNSDDSSKLTRVISRGIESRRSEIGKVCYKKIIEPIWKMNSGQLKNRPQLKFTPRNVALDFDPNFLRYMMEMYANGDLSRESTLSIMDYDQDEEAILRKFEAENYDKIFTPRARTAGRAGSQDGGTRNGGGFNRESQSPNPVPRRPESDVPDADNE